jgi:mannose-6-phosphate isomerase
VDCRDAYTDAAGEESFVSLLVLEGSGSFSCGETSFPLTKGESVFIPANAGIFTVTGEIQLLETRI